MIKQGKAWKFGDNISTDHIAPGRLFHLRTNLPELAKHVLEDADPDFPKRVKPGDIIAAGSNFGLGSSREHAPLIIKMAGISAILAKSFARIFYRNAINNGFLAIECKDIAKKVKDGDELEIDLKNGVIKTKKDKYNFTQLPEFALELLKAGGLLKYIKRK